MVYRILIKQTVLFNSVKLNTNDGHLQIYRWQTYRQVMGEFRLQILAIII